jgi:hypothetical protein
MDVWASLAEATSTVGTATLSNRLTCAAGSASATVSASE